MREVVATLLKRIVRDKAGLAARLYPWRRSPKEERLIELDPALALGRAYFQATKGASNKQIMRELRKRGLTEAQIAEIEAALARAEQMMGEQLGRIIPPP